ncbi:MAG: nucleotide exchange factor GrpE [Rhodobiaceae bacterium]|jgi:molecular chaperone GrpE|nr:nucleotide exchange factor GrpE [Rhodobiaceae bacterium]
MSDDKDTNETDTPTQMEAEQATQDSASEMDTAEAILETAEAALEEGATSAEEAPEAAPAPPTPEEQIATLNDQVLRTLAELENTRRRAERDRSEALKYGAVSFARDMVGVADNLQRALKAANEMDEASKAALPETVQAVLEGVAATERDLLAALGRHKVKVLSPMGEKFDPNLHEALFEAPGTGQDAGTIIDVIETGYQMEERLLRPAKVGIAKD